jgi:hypothetical protein
MPILTQLPNGQLDRRKTPDSKICRKMVAAAVGRAAEFTGTLDLAECTRSA